MTEEIFDMFCECIIVNGIASQDEIDLVCSICGREFKTFYDIIYVRTSFRSFEQLKTNGFYIPNDKLIEYDNYK
jgi:hypothetical protein